MTWVRKNLWVCAWLVILAALWLFLGHGGWALPRDASAHAWPGSTPRAAFQTSLH